jgi:hypothetical protein
MRRLLLPIVLLAAACGGSGDSSDNTREWLHVLGHKKAAVAPNATPQQKQAYADSLGAFVQKHPTHSRARELYQRIQLDFAGELSSLGRYQDAVRVYRAVLVHDPVNADARRGMAEAVARLEVSRDKLLLLERGMSQRDVAHILGKPIPGWTARTERRDSVIEAWYYRTTDGGIAGVYFRDGELLVAEPNSQAKLAAMN